MYLRDVEYQVEAHIQWNEQRPELSKDRDFGKHMEIAKRSVAAGGRRDIYLGTRECQGYVEPCVFGEDKGFYDDYDAEGEEYPFGVMFHGFDYPDEADGEFAARWWHSFMKNGVITFPQPSETNINMRQFIRRDVVKKFMEGVNFICEPV